jgi:hypothetical protein
VLALVEARFASGTHEFYQLPLGLRPESERVIATAGGWTFYDALADPVHGRELLEMMRSGRDAQAGDEGLLEFRWAADGDGLGRGAAVRPVGVEQSNSSIVYGDALSSRRAAASSPGSTPRADHAPRPRLAAQASRIAIAVTSAIASGRLGSLGRAAGDLEVDAVEGGPVAEALAEAAREEAGGWSCQRR